MAVWSALMKTIAVIVPCFNIERFVAQTLRTLQSSAGEGIKFVLVDDGSTDSTGTILQSATRMLPGARVITHPNNLGLGAARNTGIEATDTDYLTFLDGDDWVAPGYFATLRDTIDRLGCDMIRTDHVRVHGRRRSVHRVAYGPRGVVGDPRDGIAPASRQTSVDFPNAWSGAYSRRLADNGVLHFNPDLKTCEDRPWAWRLHLRAETFAVVGLAGVFYRRDVSDSLTAITDERQFDFIPAYEEILGDVLADREADRFLPKALRAYLGVMVHHLNRRPLYHPDLAKKMSMLCRASLLRQPRAATRSAVASLDAKRAGTLDELLGAW